MSKTGSKCPKALVTPSLAILGSKRWTWTAKFFESAAWTADSRVSFRTVGRGNFSSATAASGTRIKKKRRAKRNMRKDFREEGRIGCGDGGQGPSHKPGAKTNLKDFRSSISV